MVTLLHYASIAIENLGIHFCNAKSDRKKIFVTQFKNIPKTNVKKKSDTTVFIIFNWFLRFSLN